MKGSVMSEPLTIREITLCRVALLTRMTKLKLEHPARYQEIKEEHDLLLEKLWHVRKRLERRKVIDCGET